VSLLHKEINKFTFHNPNHFYWLLNNITPVYDSASYVLISKNTLHVYTYTVYYSCDYSLAEVFRKYRNESEFCYLLQSVACELMNGLVYRKHYVNAGLL